MATLTEREQTPHVLACSKDSYVGLDCCPKTILSKNRSHGPHFEVDCLGSRALFETACS
jgi:hypothetical protein